MYRHLKSAFFTNDYKVLVRVNEYLVDDVVPLEPDRMSI